MHLFPADGYDDDSLLLAIEVKSQTFRGSRLVQFLQCLGLTVDPARVGQRSKVDPFPRSFRVVRAIVHRLDASANTLYGNVIEVS